MLFVMKERTGSKLKTSGYEANYQQRLCIKNETNRICVHINVVTFDELQR
jgi:hypothetical protein